MDKNEITKRLVAGSARQDVAWLMSQIERRRDRAGIDIRGGVLK